MNKHTAWAEINLQAIKDNIKQLQLSVNPKTTVMAVVKANAYGHGLVKVAQTAVNTRIKYLGVSRFHEAVELRENGISVPILIFGYTYPENIEQLCNYDLTQTLFSLDMARRFSAAASKIKKNLKVHLKIDTGMGRLGLCIPQLKDRSIKQSYFSKAIKDITTIAALPHLNIEGIFTHFAKADDHNSNYTKLQFDLFCEYLDTLSTKKLSIPIKHAANSAAILDLPETHLDMVRAGLAIYGLYPTLKHTAKIKLKPAMEIKAIIIQLKKVPKDFKVSYGTTYCTKKPTTIATIPIGYADGYHRALSSKGKMLIHDRKAPVVGKVCMDITMLDVGRIPNVAEGDEVIIMGSQGKNSITAEDIASHIGTINYETISTMATRIPRVYKT